VAQFGHPGTALVTGWFALLFRAPVPFGTAAGTRGGAHGNAHLQRIAEDPAVRAYCAKFAARQRATAFTSVNLPSIGPITA